MTRVAGLIAMFLLGGLVGALGFQHIGFNCVVPLASLLLVLSMPLIARERRRAAFCWMSQPAKPTEHH